MNKQRGITLVALVVTIIVLIILAGISINLILGDNGIITQAMKAKLATEDSQELEHLKLAIGSALVKGDGKITTENLQNGIDENLGYGELIFDGQWKYFGKSKLYEIDLEGNIIELEKQSIEDVLKNGQINIQVVFVENVPEVTITTDCYADLKYKINDGEWVKITSGEKITVTIEEGTERNLKTGDIVYAILEYKGEYSEQIEKIISEYEAGVPGIYDDSNNLLKTWEELEELGLDIEQDYTTNKTEGTMYNLLGKDYILRDKSKKLIIGDVEKIGSYSVYDCGSFNEIKIPEGVTSIGDYSFWRCNSLKSVIIPKSVTNMGNAPFASCSNLVTAGPIGSGANVEFGWSTDLPNKAFYSLSSLSEIKIPETITSIGDYAFYQCSKLVEVKIPSTVTSIGNNAFRYCSALTEITIPKGVTSIGENAFEGCSNGLSSIIVSPNNKKYDSRDNCNAIIETETNTLILGCKNTVIPSNIINIADYAFYGCIELQELVIPNSVATIGEYAFSGCDNLTELIIPEGVTSIGTRAFGYCDNLEKVIVSEGITYLGTETFRECTNLSKLILPETFTGKIWSALVGCSNMKTAGPIGSGANIEFGWKTTIPDNVFSSFSGLTEVIIPEGIISIGSAAFSQSGVTKVKIPSTVTSIGKRAFMYCSCLTEITIPEGVTNIETFTFTDCQSLTSVTIDSASISNALISRNSCNELIMYATEIYINEDITKIGSYITNNYTKEVEQDKAGYVRYVKK